MLDFVISRSDEFLASFTKMPFSKIKHYYEVKDIVFNI